MFDCEHSGMILSTALFKNATIVRCIIDNIELADEETGMYFDGANIDNTKFFLSNIKEENIVKIMRKAKLHNCSCNINGNYININRQEKTSSLASRFM